MFMFASVPMLFFGLTDYNFEILTTIILTILALYSGFFATLLWNDITDIDIDRIAHPSRPLPMGRIGIKNMFLIALLFSFFTFLFSYLVNLWCFILVLCSALFVAIHNKYLKKKVSIPAYSELFTPLQWLIVPIFGFLAVNKGFYPIDEGSLQLLVLLTFFTYLTDAGHDLPEGIVDAEADRKYNVRTYATNFGVKNAARISFFMFLFSGILGFLLFFKSVLSFVFLILFTLVWLYAMYNSLLLLCADENQMQEIGKRVGRNTFRYFWLTFDIIFIDIFIQLFIVPN
jgi:geranylgeranylglycerol-phosphate geranylgeranyltransferase